MNTATSKTALLLPGLDAVFSAAAIKRWLDKPFIKEKLQIASQHLCGFSDQEENLHKFAVESKRLHLADFDRTLIVLTTLQVAIAEKINEKYDWEIAQGCSHGDLARNVVCDVNSFKDSIEMLWTFAQLRKNLPEGYTANVRTNDLSPITDAQLLWLKEKKAPVSKWSHSHATIAGESGYINSLREEAKMIGLKVKPVLPYPVHSDAMSPMLKHLGALVGKWDVRAPKKPVFSSLWVRFLETREDLIAEGLKNFISPVLWTDTLKHLHKKEGVQKFINIGPANTLTSWIMESPEYKNLEILDAWEALGFDQ